MKSEKFLPKPFLLKEMFQINLTTPPKLKAYIGRSQPEATGLREAREDRDKAASVEVINANGRAPIVLVCEHASSHIPSEFKNLALGEDTLHSHIAWDPGALAVAKRLAKILDAPLVAQKVSRLLYDCNRDPSAPDAVPAKSEIYSIPGNFELSSDDIAARTAQFYVPFKSTLSDVIAKKVQENKPLALVTIHSFTPVYFGKPRLVELGILHDSDSRLADEILGILRAESELEAQRNQPYGPEDGVTHTLIEHGVKNGMLNVMIEIRNDLIVEESAQHEMAELLASVLSKALGTADSLGDLQPAAESQ